MSYYPGLFWSFRNGPGEAGGGEKMRAPGRVGRHGGDTGGAFYFTSGVTHDKAAAGAA